jgi:hypothetical protein
MNIGNSGLIYRSHAAARNLDRKSGIFSRFGNNTNICISSQPYLTCDLVRGVLVGMITSVLSGVNLVRLSGIVDCLEDCLCDILVG